ncbi:hypothetical protein B0A48_18649 [Cryoendolithus antarcticus]|uniref:BHLH domain-containing protein n=1 Tax=Cryoendolithus antarcticus TaxID=1507870 RepID=A0A1V8S813_9PEZI|nr:hypothetical protein B0A48_18649 [Cryoendolithus antarcticus]
MFSDDYGLCPPGNLDTAPDSLLWQQPAGNSRPQQQPDYLAQSPLTPPVEMDEVSQQTYRTPVNGSSRSGRNAHAMSPRCAPYLTPSTLLRGPSCPGHMDYRSPQALSYLRSAQTSSAPSTSLMATPQQLLARPKMATAPTRASTRSLAAAHKGKPRTRRPPLKRPDSTPPTKSSRIPHSVVERRYRDKLRSQLDALTSKVPVLKESYPCSLDIEDSSRSMKGPSKAVVISAATKHIERLEAENVRSVDFVKSLQDQIVGLQRLVRCDERSVLRYLQGLQIPTLQELG